MKKRTVAMILLLAMCLCSWSCAADPNAESNTTEAPDKENPTDTPTTEAPTTGELTTEEPATGDEPKEETPLPTEETYGILFVGNSHTYKNDMPTALFAEIAKAAGYKVEVLPITKGGAKLTLFEDTSSTQGKELTNALASGKYRYVVLQEMISRPATDPEAYYTSVRNLNKKITAAGADAVLYQVWGGAPGNPKLPSGYTPDILNYRTAKAAETIAAELNAYAGYAGLAFMYATANSPAINLFADDGYHPSYEGSYLAAMTLFATIFHVDPTTVEWNGTLTEEVATALKTAAKETVFNTPEIPTVEPEKGPVVEGTYIGADMPESFKTAITIKFDEAINLEAQEVVNMKTNNWGLGYVKEGATVGSVVAVGVRKMSASDTNGVFHYYFDAKNLNDKLEKDVVAADERITVTFTVETAGTYTLGLYIRNKDADYTAQKRTAVLSMDGGTATTVTYKDCNSSEGAIADSSSGSYVLTAYTFELTAGTHTLTITPGANSQIHFRNLYLIKQAD